VAFREEYEKIIKNIAFLFINNTMFNYKLIIVYLKEQKMKTISKNLFIMIVVLFVFGLATGQLNKVDEWLAVKQQNKEVIVFNAPISTFNLGK